MAVNGLGDEEGRLCALYRYGIPQTNMGDAMNRLVKIAIAATGAPIAAISVIERSQQSFLAAIGIEMTPITLEKSLCALAIGERGPLILENIDADLRTRERAPVVGGEKVRAYLGVPISTPDGYRLGTVSIMDTSPREFTETDVTVLVNLAELAMTHIATHQPDTTDFATGALTRHRFQADVEREFERAKRYERPATMIFLDIDQFADINAAIGHEMGDDVLRAVVNRCKEVTRQSDSFGRVGGQSFGLLLPETMTYEASQCAERIREAIGKLRFRTADGVLSITASFGVAALTPDIGTAMQWFAQADIALFGAKRAGKNCVVIAPPIDTEDELDAREKSKQHASANIH